MTSEIESEAYTVETYDFGNVFVHSAQETEERLLTHNFKCRNETTQMLTLNVLGTSCSCTQAKLSNTRVEPGQEYTVSLKVEVSGQKGPIQDYALVGNENGVGEVNKLSVSANVIPIVEIRAAQGIPMHGPPGKVLHALYECSINQPFGEPKTPISVAIRPDDIEWLRIDCVKKSNQNSKKTSFDTDTYKIALEGIVPADNVKAHHAFLEVKSGEVIESVPLSIKQDYPISVSPAVVFVHVPFAETVRKQLRLSCNEDFQIIDIRIVPDASNIQVLVEPDHKAKQQTISLQCKARSDESGRIAETFVLHIQTDCERQAQLNVPLRVLYALSDGEYKD